MQDKRIFFASFAFLSFAMKIVAEFVHEIGGHGLFVLLLGGTIKSSYISILWPYDFSHIGWNLPSGVLPGQMAWVYGGGILVCLLLSLGTQAFLLMKRNVPWYAALAVFWFAFWTFTNSTGYLLIGALRPFGDIYDLIELGAFTTPLSLATGLSAFLTSFASLSWILRRILIGQFSRRGANLGVVIFWLIIPLLIAVALINPDKFARTLIVARL